MPMRSLFDHLPSREQVAIKALASFAGSVMTGLVVTPLQVLKVRWQVLRQGPHANLGASSTSLAALTRSILAKEGPLAFWRGARTSLVMVGPSTALYMVCYETNKGVLQAALPAGAVAIAPMIASGWGRAVSGTVFAPLEFIRTNQAALGLRTMRETWQRTVRSSGIGGLYTGTLQTLYRDVPFSAIYWLALEHATGRLVDSGIPSMRAPPPRSGCRAGASLGSGGLAQPSSLAVLISSAGSGVLAAVLTHPFDTIKTRLQVAATSAPHPSHRGVTAYSIVREMRLSVFYRGLGLRLMTVIPSSTTMFTTYAFMKRVFGEAAF